MAVNLGLSSQCVKICLQLEKGLNEICEIIQPLCRISKVKYLTTGCDISLFFFSYFLSAITLIKDYLLIYGVYNVLIREVDTPPVIDSI